MSGDDVHDEAAAPCAKVGRGSAMSEGALIQRARSSWGNRHQFHSQSVDREGRMLVDPEFRFML